jgi:prepilin-type N-terminal cleavage/methylation domain-containing protein
MKIPRTFLGRVAPLASAKPFGAAGPRRPPEAPLPNCGRAGRTSLPFALQSAFTLVEIAICLAIIGIALVAIIGVLPLGVNVQKDNREETLINQDATVLMEAIRGGASSPYGFDLTNYVYAITNFQTKYSPGPAPVVPTPGWDNNTYLTNNARIIGLLSTPEYTDAANGMPLDNLFTGGCSNYIVAYVRSISGPASEKPPQDNPIVTGGSFGYRIICENVPVTVDTNIFSLPSTDPRRIYSDQLTANLHELRLTFQWPLLPNGKVGSKRQTFRTTVAGQIVQTSDNGQWLYFFQSQSFTNAP